MAKAGGAGGLGSAIAQAFAERGAKLTIGDVDHERAVEVAKSLPGARHTACRLDITDETSCSAAVSLALEAEGRLDVAVNASGSFATAAALELDAERFRKSIDVNLTGPFLFSRAAARGMIDGGRPDHHLASVSSTVVNPGYAAYSSSKAGLKQLVRILAREWAEHRITVLMPSVAR